MMIALEVHVSSAISTLDTQVVQDLRLRGHDCARRFQLSEEEGSVKGDFF